MSNFYLEKNKDTNEIIYLEYDKLNGYNIKPKKQYDNAIEVNKIVFVSPTLTEKLIKKKIERELNSLLIKLKTIETDDETGEGAIKDTLMQAERLKLNIIQNYVKFLGNTYQSLTLKKIQVIINELRIKLYNIKDNKIPLFIKSENEEKKGKGR